MEQQLKVSRKGGLVVTLKELMDMQRIGMKYKINHRTKDLIAFREFLNKEIQWRKNHAKNKEKENHAESKKPSQN